MERFEIVEKNKASKGLRLANVLIDLAVFYFAIFAIALVLGLLSGLLHLNIDFASMENLNTVADRLITICFLVIYYFLLEKFLKGRTIGKLITGTKVVTEDGDEPTTKDYFMRSLSRIVPFDNFSFLGKNGWHDKWTETRVVVAKQFEFDVQNQIDIDNFGITEI